MNNDKQALLDAGNYEIYSRDIMRKVFPRIIGEIRAVKPRAKAGDIIPLYFMLLTNINGQSTLKNGEPNPKYGACFLSQEELVKHTGIGVNRLPILAEILLRNGLLLDVKDVWIGTNRYKYYYPSYCPRITEDGFIVDENGEKVVPEYGDIIAKL